ncbi:MAG: NAD(P)-binding protein [Bryobacteraceae bacterium]|jgi:voltage-gated potassium channel Kch
MEDFFAALLPPVRERTWWRRVPLVFALLSYVLGYIAFGIVEYQEKVPVAPIEALYLSAQLLILHMPRNELPKRFPLALFYAARVSAVVAWAAFGILATTIIFNRQLRLWWTVWKGDHTVICGLGGAGLELVEDATRKGERVIVIDPESGAAAGIHAEESGASLLPGSPAEPQLLRKAGIHSAQFLLAATGDDSANIAAVVRAREVAPEKRARAFIHVADPQLRVLLRRQRTFRSDGPTPATIFNVFDNSARLLLRDYPLDHVRVRPETEQVVQLIVIGFGLMGEALLTRAALTGHYANFKRLQAVVIDRSADRKERLFRNRYPHFEDVADARFKQLDAEEPATQNKIAALCADSAKTSSTIVIAFDDPAHGLSIALSLLNSLRCYAPIRLRLNDESSLVALLPRGQITGFGSIREASQRKSWLDSDLDAMARKLHEDYLAKLPEAERSRPEIRSSYPWDRLDDDLVESNRQAADHIPVKLRAVGCHTVARGNQDDAGVPVDRFEGAELELLAKMEHKRWTAERFLAGWTLGQKDVEKRTSPYLVEWEDLPPNIQEYDRNFVRIIPGVLKSVNLEIRR